MGHTHVTPVGGSRHGSSYHCVSNRVSDMLQSILRPSLADDSSRANLEDLRQQLAGRLVLVLVCAGGFIAWAILPIRPFPTEGFTLALCLVGLGAAAWALNGWHTRLARHMLVWGTTALLLVSLWFFDAAWLPFLGLLIIFVNAFLIGSSGWLAACAIAGLTLWLGNTDPQRAYPIPALLIAFVVGVSLAWLVINTLYTALQWARTMQRRADDLLEEAQNNQAELKRTLKSLELATYQIERSNQELLVAREYADEARRMKEQFAANISHELRTPLNLILGFSEMMYFSPEVYGNLQWPSTLRRDVYQIHRSSVHLLEMIDDILDLSRFEISGFTLNKERMDLEPLLRGAAEIASGLLRGRPIELNLALQPGLPALDIDQTRIRQVVLNLLSNAQRFTTQGVISLHARREADEVIISVQDTGRGIAADKLPHIFEEFYQVDSSLRRSHEGAGLGLAICKRFVQAHDGRIWVESEVGIGSTFYIALPVPGTLTPISQARLVTPLRPAPSKGRPTILVVDPDPAVAAMIGRRIEGYAIVQLEDESRVQEALVQQAAQAVIVNVPPEGIRRGAASGPQAVLGVPAIRCSLPSQAWIANELAVAACLTKPITSRQLLREIDRLDGVHDVLIVDDDPGFGELVERILSTYPRKLGIRRAYDGQQALQVMMQRRPDLVLTDLAMPGMDGFEMLAHMRRTPELSQVPVILLTVTSYAEDALQRHMGRIVVEREGGLQSLEVLRCLQALLGALSQHAHLEERVQDVVAPDRLMEVERRAQ